MSPTKKKVCFDAAPQFATSHARSKGVARLLHQNSEKNYLNKKGETYFTDFSFSTLRECAENHHHEIPYLEDHPRTWIRG